MLALGTASAAAACSGEQFGSTGGEAASGGTSGSSGSQGSGGSKAGAGGTGSSASGGSGAGVASGGSGGGVAGGGSSGKSSGGTGGMPRDGGFDAPLPCTQAIGCPTPTSRCRLAVCINNLCGEAPLAPGTAPDEPHGDCLKITCVGGEEQIFADPSDTDDGRECTADACTGTTPSHTPRTGQICSVGYCNANGNCAGCSNDSQCSGGTECKPHKCINSVCTPQSAPPATFCHAYADQCDGNGNCVDCVDNGGCGECCVCFNNVCIQA
jgi:hypothetical protein